MGTKKRAAVKRPPARRTRAEGRAFKMTIPENVRRRLDEVASERGISVASLLLSETMRNIGPGARPARGPATAPG
jgi:hypothetical protein